MLKNFFVIAWRTLLRNKLHTIINITGLSIGISACLVIFLIVQFELSFNKGITDYKNIYRIHSSFEGVFSGLNRGVPTAVGPAIKDQFTGVDQVTSFHIFSSKVQVPSANELKDFSRQTDVVITEPSFFDVFQNYEWIAGSAKALEDPHKVILTKSKAETYFGKADESVLGREIIYRDSLHTTVVGIVNDLPFNSDIHFRDFISLNTIEKSWLTKQFKLNDWSNVNSSSQTFLKLAEGTAIDKIESQVPLLMKLYKENTDWDVQNKFKLQSLADLHYSADTGIFDNSREPAHLPTLSTLVAVAFMLLIIGAINFINLETTQAVSRAKEVGVRKVLGSSRARLISQFLAQSFIVTLIAVLLALPLSEAAIQFFHEFIPKGISLDITLLAPVLFVLTLVVSLLAGLYPAFALSSYLPAVALKNQVYVNSRYSGSAFLRKSLFVFQFTFAQILIIATFIVGWQVNFLLTKNMGFKKESVVYFDTPWQTEHSKTLVLKNELEKLSGISKISLSNSPPAYNGWSSSTVIYKAKEEIKVNAYRKFGDTQFLDFYGIQLLAGRNLSLSDSVKEFLINETLMKHLGFTSPEEAIGKELEYSKKLIPIVGVVKDFHFQSLHTKVEPVIMANEMNNFSTLNVMLTASEGDAVKKTLASIEQTWKKVYPEQKIEINFLDETIKSFYETEQRITKLIYTATGLAILISCLGLFGLASFTAIQRTKEIGIRKVLGATSQSIVMLLSRDFLILVIIAFVLAVPLSWIGGNMWLETFAYRADIEPWLFMATGFVATLIALLTVSYQTLKAANRNPVNSLRTE